VVYEPWYFANPVQKTLFGEVTGIEDKDPHEHLVWYTIEGEPCDRRVDIDNQFGPQTIDLLGPNTLAVPSQKISWEQPLDHFKCYSAVGTPVFEPVQLVDQFGAINATVGEPVGFANPASKEYGDLWTPTWNPNNHLTFYQLYYEGIYPEWWVKIDNQFGTNQQLWLYGPLYLAVPTQKSTHDLPEYLDHYLVYGVSVSANTPEGVMVDLWDQFCFMWPWADVNIYEPTLFANPVQKTHESIVTSIKNESDHLVFYIIDGGDFSLDGLSVANQFGPDFLNVFQAMYDLLGVPSVKVEWGPAS